MRAGYISMTLMIHSAHPIDYQTVYILTGPVIVEGDQQVQTADRSRSANHARISAACEGLQFNKIGTACEDSLQIRPCVLSHDDDPASRDGEEQGPRRVLQTGTDKTSQIGDRLRVPSWWRADWFT